MPEGDTVWHTATILRDALAGKTLTRCDVRVPKYATVDLTGQAVDEVISRGKHLFIRVGSGSIHSHLKMEGSWKVNPASKPSRAGHRIRIILEAGDIQAAGIDLGCSKYWSASRICRWSPTSAPTCSATTGIRMSRRRT